MASITIAFNNDVSVDSHRFFQTCGDIALEHCVNSKHEWHILTPPNLYNDIFLEQMETDSVCMIASHGDSYAIYNESNEHIISTETVNYNLNDKVIYTIACHCGKELGRELERIGAKIFVGYNDSFHIGADEEVFARCALSGFDNLLSGRSLHESLCAMMTFYDQAIATSSQFDQILLLDNKENLMCYGDGSSHI